MYDLIWDKNRKSISLSIWWRATASLWINFSFDGVNRARFTHFNFFFRRRHSKRDVRFGHTTKMCHETMNNEKKKKKISEPHFVMHISFYSSPSFIYSSFVLPMVFLATWFLFSFGYFIAQHQATKNQNHSLPPCKLSNALFLRIKTEEATIQPQNMQKNSNNRLLE